MKIDTRRPTHGIMVLRERITGLEGRLKCGGMGVVVVCHGGDLRRVMLALAMGTGAGCLR